MRAAGHGREHGYKATAADGLVFVSILPHYGEPGGTKVYPATCSTATCASLARFGSMESLGGASVAGGFVYAVDKVPWGGGDDPGPFWTYVRAFALPPSGAS